MARNGAPNDAADGALSVLLALKGLVDTAIAQQAAPAHAEAQPEPELLSVSEFAARCSFTGAAVRRLCHEGMPHIRPRPRLIRIPVSRALDWLAAQRTGGVEAARLGRVAARRGH